MGRIMRFKKVKKLMDEQKEKDIKELEEATLEFTQELDNLKELLLKGKISGKEFTEGVSEASQKCNKRRKEILDRYNIRL